MRTLTLLVFLCGCDGAPIDEDEASIQGGRADKADPAVGLIWFSHGGFCSGSLIAPDVVLTAGHCVAEKIDGFYTGAGNQGGVGKPTGMVRHAVADQVAYPTYSIYGGCPNPTFDVGLVRLTKKITDVTPLPRAMRVPNFSTKGCRIVGFGRHTDSSGEDSFAQKRSATVNMVAVATAWIEIVWKSGISDQGDSGGPLLCNDEVVGVTSCGPRNPQHRGGFYARVDDIGKWIDGTIKKWD